MTAGNDATVPHHPHNRRRATMRDLIIIQTVDNKLVVDTDSEYKFDVPIGKPIAYIIGNTSEVCSIEPTDGR